MKILIQVSSVICWLAFGSIVLAGSWQSTEPSTIASAEIGEVGPVPAALRQRLKLDPFYQQHLDLRGLPVVGSQQVHPAAIREAAWIVDRLLGHRPDILKAMAENKTRLSVMAHNEYTTDVPEHRHLKPRDYWDRRARGLGATRRAPAVSCAEENLLGHPGDPYSTENICIHEFAHAIHQMGLNTIDPTFDDRLKQAFNKAIEAGLWEGTYAASNRNEYWAEAVQSWFDDNRQDDGQHNHVNTRAELKDYDPGWLGCALKCLVTTIGGIENRGNGRRLIGRT
jgi:hypothetical protein